MSEIRTSCRPRSSAGQCRHRSLFWAGAATTATGVALPLPAFASAAESHYKMAGMQLSPTMMVGMGLLVLGMVAAALGLVPRSAPPLPQSVPPRYALRAMDDLPLGRAHRRLIVALSLALVIDVTKPATIAFIEPGMRHEYALSAAAIAALPVVALTGTVLGSVGWGTLADRLGRRAAILLASLMFLSTTVCGAMPTFQGNLLMCFLMGLAAGGLLPIVYALMAETIPARKRALIMVLQAGLATVTGYLFTSGLSAVLLPQFGWRVMWFAEAPAAVLLLGLNRWIPESPRFLLGRGRVAEAEEIMARFGVAVVETHSALGGKPGIASIGASAATRGMAASVIALFSRAYRLRTIVIAVYALSWGIIYWGFMTFLPSLLDGVSGVGVGSSKLLFLSSLLSIPGTFLVALLYSRWSSHKTMAVYGGLTVLSLLALSIGGLTRGGEFLAVVVVMLLLTGTTGVVALLAPYTAEVYPTSIRGNGSGFAAACSKAGGIFGPPAIAAILAYSPGTRLAAVVVAIPMAAAAAAIGLKGMETRGRRVEELDHVVPTEGNEADRHRQGTGHAA